MRSELYGIVGKSIQVDIEPPQRIVHVGHHRVGRPVGGGCAYPAHHNAVVAKRPFHHIVVVGRAQCPPQCDLLSAPYIGIVFPRQTAVAHLFANHASERSATERRGTIGSTDRLQNKRIPRHVVKAM